MYMLTAEVMQALKILQDETQCDIIKIAGLVRNKVHTVAEVLIAPCA